MKWTALLLPLLLLLLPGCSRQKLTTMCGMHYSKNTDSTDNDFSSFTTPEDIRNNFHVTAIDSTENLYLIYGSTGQDSSLIKIPSLRIDNDCRNVKVGGYYPFLLNPMTAPFKIGDMVVNVQTMCLVTHINYGGYPIALERGKVASVCTVHNLKGLCFQPTQLFLLQK